MGKPRGVGSDRGQVMVGRTAAFALSLSAHFSLMAQEAAVGARPVHVPFVGCKSDGQVGPVEAPTGESPLLPIPAEAAPRLAYYESARGLAVLAPRGWYCLGLYGSGGDALYVTAQPIDTAKWFSNARAGFLGPVIEVDRSLGDTSGRYEVAEVIARIFPAHRKFVNGVIELFDIPPDTFPSGPYPRDTLKYKSDKIVEFQTPGNADGLGTRSWVRKNASPISGVAILVGDTPDLLLLSARLPADLAGLTPVIVQQVEREALLDR